MTKHEYFLESISEALSDVGKFDALTQADRAHIAEAVEGGVENMSQAFYSPPAKDMESSEISRLKARVKDLEREAEDWQNAFRKNVAMRRGVEPHEVSIKKTGHAEIDGRR